MKKSLLVLIVTLSLNLIVLVAFAHVNQSSAVPTWKTVLR